MVAAMVTLVLGTSLVSLSFVAEQVNVTTTWQSQLLGRLALFSQMHDFARGVIDTRPVIFFLSLTFFFLFLTLRAVESRRWK
jgi:ABC-2 type transport system permease protein